MFPAPGSHLNLWKKQLGRVPDSVWAQTDIETLVLADNQLSEVSEQVGRQLRELHLRNNKLTSLPASIGTILEFRQLDLRGNPLSHLPAGTTALPRLEKLDLRWVVTREPPEWIAKLEERGCVVYL